MARWDPFADSFRIVERFGGRFRLGPEADFDDDAAAPPADVFEDREGVHIEVELPGVSPRDVAVTVSSGSIIVEAERSFSTAGSRNVTRLEGRYGRMRRAFVLPIRSQPEKAMAELRNGVLRLFVPRQLETAAVTQRVEPRADERTTPISVG